MREENNYRSDEGVNGNLDTERPTTANDNSLNGFTAVNGDSHRSSSFRPEESAKQYIPPSANEADRHRKSAPINTSFHSHGWRPDDRPLQEVSSQTLQDELRKRKRSISVNVDNQDDNDCAVVDGDDRNSPKRRATSTLDSAIDLTSPVTNMQAVAASIDRRQHEPAPRGPYARERSPVARWNRGEPPTRARPETEASLAESVSKFRQLEGSHEPPQVRAVSVQQASSPLDGQDQQEANASDDDEPQGDDSDPKKARKRNFTHRTKTGCHTCRERKKKCDEGKPTCGNCERGNFSCKGYGPKPPNGTKVVQTRHLHVQPKGYETPSVPGAFYQSPSDEVGRSYSHWGRVPAPEHASAEHGHPYPEPGVGDHRYPPPSRDSWHRHGWPQPTPSHFHDRFPPPDYPASHQHPAHYPYPPSHPSLPPPHTHTAPPPSITDPFANYNSALEPLRPQRSNYAARPGTVASSNSGSQHSLHSNPQSHSAHTASLALTLAGAGGFPHLSEKDKMLRGQPFLHWLDTTLIGERDSCAIAVDCYNKGSRSDKGLTCEAKTSLFAQILNPAKRIHGGQRANTSQQGPSPVGTVKDHTIVQAPFKCDYGYNIHLGRDSAIQSGCHLQDAADITIGDRVILGPEVKVYTLSVGVESGSRKGSQGPAVAGAVCIEDDVFIGAGSTILPYCTVGKGAVVGAGSVVTRDVKENTVVAGNPAKFIRSINNSGSSSVVLEGQVDRRHAYEIQERNERVKKRMVEYADSGFNQHSPRLI